MNQRLLSQLFIARALPLLCVLAFVTANNHTYANTKWDIHLSWVYIYFSVCFFFFTFIHNFKWSFSIVSCKWYGPLLLWVFLLKTNIRILMFVRYIRIHKLNWNWASIISWNGNKWGFQFVYCNFFYSI